MIEGLSHRKIFDRKTRSSILVSGTELVHDYLRILLLSDFNEFQADPSYGCSLKTLLFDHNNSVLEDIVKDGIVSAIRTYEPSITVTYDDISIERLEDRMNITIQYSFTNETNISTSLTLEILNTEVSY